MLDRLLRQISLFIIIILSVICFCVVRSTITYAQSPGSSSSACEGVKLTGGDCTGDNQLKVDNTIGGIVNILSYMVGIVAVIAIIVAGFRYVTSQGDASTLSAAKNSILYALVGLVIVIFAQVIVRLVVNKL